MTPTPDNDGQITVLALPGDLTQDQAGEFRAACSKRMDQRARDFVLDLHKVELIDSQGLEALLWLQEQCAEQLGQVRLVGAAEHVGKILEITRLAPLFERHDSVDSAISSLKV